MFSVFKKPYNPTQSMQNPIRLDGFLVANTKSTVRIQKKSHTKKCAEKIFQQIKKSNQPENFDLSFHSKTKTHMLFKYGSVYFSRHKQNLQKYN